MSEKFSQHEWDVCIKVLNALKDDPFDNPDNQKFKTLITSIYKKAKKQTSNAVKADKNAHNIIVLKNAVIVKNAQNGLSEYAHKNSEQGESQQLRSAQRCYVCNQSYTQLHFYYHKLCPACADINYNYRGQQHNFTGYNVIITGGRVKIGYATALKFLRSGANVVLTTRFPALALRQLLSEPDSDQWHQRLTVYGLDLRNLKAVNQFINFCNTNLNGLDVLINNAAQTIKYPAEYYQPLIAAESKLSLKTGYSNLLKNDTPVVGKQESLLPYWPLAEIPVNRFGQPVDSRDKNSWNSTLTEIELEELLEVNLINHISPYRLISGLKELMLKSKRTERFVINVTSSEGQFSYFNKTIYHPHTNMTKAALNMLTRTAAHEFIKDSIFMTAVDVGWISTGAVEAKRERLFNNFNIPPLDPLDGAMRIVHAIDEVLKGNKLLFGVLLKNYRVVDW